jgi:hypothetical protein
LSQPKKEVWGGKIILKYLYILLLAIILPWRIQYSGKPFLPKVSCFYRKFL